MKLSFRQFNQFVDMGEDASDEQLTEIFGFFKNQTKLDQAKQKRQELEKKYGKEAATKQYALRQKQKNLAWAKAKAQAEKPEKPFDKKPSSELTAAQNRAAERDWVRSMQTEDKSPDNDDKPFEVHGVMGLNSKPFRKTFKNRAAFEKWMETHDGDVDVQGYRDLDESQIMEARKPKVHTFKSTPDAYDRCQYDESIKIGDTLVIPSEQVVGIADAWPVAVTEKHGALHTVVDGHSMKKHFAHDGLSGVVEHAVAVAKKHGWPVRKEAMMEAKNISY